MSLPMWHEIQQGAYAYEAYRRASAGRSLESGEPMADWNDLNPEIQRAWIETAADLLMKFGAIY